MVRYPKLPQGPSAPGAAGVRALQAVGGNWQKRHPAPGVTSHLMGNHQRVTLEGLQYVASGRRYRILKEPSSEDESTLGTDIARGLPDYRQAAQPFEAGKLDQYPADNPNWKLPYFADPSVYTDQDVHGLMSPRMFYSQQVANWSATGGVYTYPSAAPPGTKAITVYFHFVDVLVYHGPLRRQKRKVTTQCVVSQIGALSAWPPVDAVAHRYLGQFDLPGGGGEHRTMLTFTRDSARTDSAGRPLQDLAVLVVGDESDPVEVVVGGLPDADLDWLSASAHVVVRNASAFLVAAQRAFNATASPRTITPSIWVVNMPDLMPISAAVANAAPVALAGSPYGPDFDIEDSGFATDYNDRLEYSLASSRFVVMPDDSVLWFMRVPTSAVSTWLRVIRLTFPGATPTAAVLADLPVNGFMTEARGAVHLGAGKVLVKGVQGSNAEDSSLLPLRFARSTDAGATWAQVVPTGLPDGLGTHQAGDMVLHTAADGDSDGVVLMPVWDDVVRRYSVYASRDAGATWQRRGSIYRVPADERGYFTETMNPGHGDLVQGQFQFLARVDGRAPIDPSYPGRYVRTP